MNTHEQATLQRKVLFRATREAKTLNIEEVLDAGRDGVALAPEGGIMMLPDGGSLHHQGSDHIFHSGCFRHLDDGRWEFAGSMWSVTGVYEIDFDLSVSACEALDRVREYWRRRALAEFAAAKVADLLSTALAAAREHAMLFAKIADDGVLPIDRAQKFRADAADLAHPIREIERLHNSYKVHGDVP